MLSRILATVATVHVIVLATSCDPARAPTPNSRSNPRSALEVLSSRPVWRELPRNFLSLLANKLGSADKASEFAQLCEKTGILENNIIAFVPDYSDDPGVALGLLTRTLTTYANAMGERGKLSDAKHALELALLLKPRWWPAWSSMALVAINQRDCPAAVSWADKVLTFKPDLKSEDPWERALADMMTPEGQKLAGEILKDPNAIGSWERVREQRRAIKDSCGD